METKRQTLLWFMLTAVTFLAVGFYALKGRLFPIVGAIVFVYLTKPLQRTLKGLGLSTRSSALLISLLLLSVICFLLLYGLPILITELTRLIMQLPSSIKTTYSLLNQFLAPYDIVLDSDELPKVLTQVISSKDLSALQDLPNILSSTVKRFIDIILFFTSIIFLPLFFFFALQHGDNIRDSILSSVPQSIRQDIADFINIVHETLSSWIAGQGGIIICLCALYSIGFFAINIPYAMTLGVVTGLLYIIPAVGPFIALALVSTIAISSSGLSAFVLLQVIGLFSAIQVTESLILAPFFVGNQLGLNLPMLLFAILIGGGLFGGAGIIFSVPTASILKKTIIMIRQKQSADWIYD